MENEQAEQLTVKPKISKTPVFELLVLIASLVSAYIFFKTRPFLAWYADPLAPPSVLITTSVVFALSATALIRQLFLRPVKWRSSAFVYLLIATVLSALITIPLLLEAININMT
jgi:hypothetical protein